MANYCTSLETKDKGLSCINLCGALKWPQSNKLPYIKSSKDFDKMINLLRFYLRPHLNSDRLHRLSFTYKMKSFDSDMHVHINMESKQFQACFSDKTHVLLQLHFWNGCEQEENCTPDLILNSRTDLKNAQWVFCFCKHVSSHIWPIINSFGQTFPYGHYFLNWSFSRGTIACDYIIWIYVIYIMTSLKKVCSPANA